jgi:hypothetical protein
VEEVTQPGYSLASIDVESTFSSTAVRGDSIFQEHRPLLRHRSSLTAQCGPIGQGLLDDKVSSSKLQEAACTELVPAGAEVRIYTVQD